MCKLLLAVTLLVWMGAAWASGVPGSLFERRLELTQDTVALPKARDGAVQKLALPPCAPCWGEEMPYTAFYDSGLTYMARRYDGFDVALYVPRDGADAALMTAERVRRLVDRLDLIYRAYRDLLGYAPERQSDPRGKHVFALLPTRPSNFYGVATSPGDRTEYHADVMSEIALDDDVLSNVWVHELAHNFDPIEAWDFGDDPGHDWTSVVQVWYARRQAQMDNRELNAAGVGPVAFERNYLDTYFNRYVNNPALTWAQCAETTPLPQACADANARYLSGSLVALIGRYADPVAMKAWLRAGVAADSVELGLDSPRDRFTYMLNSLATVSQTQTQCIADEFRVPVTVTAAAPGSPLFQGCRDEDSDGVKRWQDCDDSRASVKPGATELQDTRDNDCDGVIDEAIVAESSFGGDYSDSEASPSAVGGVPLELSGTIGAPADVDYLGLTPVSPRNLNVQLCNSGQVTIELVGLPVGSGAVGPLAIAAAGACRSTQLDDNEWQTFWVRRLNAGGTAGGFTLSLSAPGAESVYPHPRAIAVAADASGGAAATIDTARVPGGLANVEIRWSALGGGEFKTTSLATPGAQSATPPSTQPSHPQRPKLVRASLWRDGMLIEEPSTAAQVVSVRIFANGFEN